MLVNIPTKSALAVLFGLLARFVNGLILLKNILLTLAILCIAPRK